jgi:hypothetical protein
MLCVLGRNGRFFRSDFHSHWEFPLDIYPGCDNVIHRYLSEPVLGAVEEKPHLPKAVANDDVAKPALGIDLCYDAAVTVVDACPATVGSIRLGWNGCSSTYHGAATTAAAAAARSNVGRIS